MLGGGLRKWNIYWFPIFRIMEGSSETIRVIQPYFYWDNISTVFSWQAFPSGKLQRWCQWEDAITRLHVGQRQFQMATRWTCCWPELSQRHWQCICDYICKKVLNSYAAAGRERGSMWEKQHWRHQGQCKKEEEGQLWVPEQRVPCSSWLPCCWPWRTPPWSWVYPVGRYYPMESLHRSWLLTGLWPHGEESMLGQVSWQDLFSCGWPTLEQSVPEWLHTMERPHTRAVPQELKPMGRTHVGEKLSHMGEIHIGTGEEHKEKGAAKTCDELTEMATTYCCLQEGGRKVKREVKPMKKAGVSCNFKNLLLFLHSLFCLVGKNLISPSRFCIAYDGDCQLLSLSLFDPQIVHNFSPPSCWGGDVIEGVGGYMETSEGQSTTLPFCIFFPTWKIKEILFLSSDTPQAHIKGRTKQKKGVKFLVVLVVSLKKESEILQNQIPPSWTHFSSYIFRRCEDHSWFLEAIISFPLFFSVWKLNWLQNPRQGEEREGCRDMRW